MFTKQMVRQMLGASLIAASACSHFHRARPTTTASATKTPAPAATTANKTPAAAPAKAASSPAPTKTTARAATPARLKNAPTDANIAAIVLAENNTDISYARLAPSRAQSAAVKEFAAQMLADHSGVNRVMNDLFTRRELNPEDNTTSLDFRDESATKRDVMRELEGHAFDAAYISNEISYHTKFLATIDSSLLVSARTPELKQLLANIRPAVAAHLAHAQQIQASLAGR